jgi:hypothetical protein
MWSALIDRIRLSIDSQERLARIYTLLLLLLLC